MGGYLFDFTNEQAFLPYKAKLAIFGMQLWREIESLGDHPCDTVQQFEFSKISENLS